MKYLPLDRHMGMDLNLELEPFEIGWINEGIFQDESYFVNTLKLFVERKNVKIPLTYKAKAFRSFGYTRPQVSLEYQNGEMFRELLITPNHNLKELDTLCFTVKGTQDKKIFGGAAESLSLQKLIRMFLDPEKTEDELCEEIKKQFCL